MNTIVRVGSPAPDFVYPGADGRQQRLSSLWADSPALVLWLRHCGCTFFSEFLAQLRETLPEFASRGVRVACVIQGRPEDAERICSRHGIESLCVPDPQKESYRAMGFGRASWRELVFAPAEVRRRWVEARRAGGRVHWSAAFRPESDWLQLPGAALVARGGEILWLHRGADFADLPPARQLLAIAAAHLTPRA